MKSMFKNEAQDGIHYEKNPAAGPDVDNSKLTSFLLLKDFVIAEVSKANGEQSTSAQTRPIIDQ